MNIAVFSIALAALGIGLSWYWLGVKGKREHFRNTMLISLLLVALFPVLLLFSIFPASEIKVNIFGFSLTGAVALFVFIWWFGTRSALKASEKDDLTEQNSAL